MKQISPFAALTNAEKQIRWMEYQTIRLPYVHSSSMEPDHTDEVKAVAEKIPPVKQERPQPPPEVPRIMPSDFQRTRHSQYDAVIARMKQAELQSRRNASQSAQ